MAERGHPIRAADHDRPDDLPPAAVEHRAPIVTRYRACVQAVSIADPAKSRRLGAHVAALGLPPRPPFARWMGVRPTLPDYLPAIGMSGRAPNPLRAFGHRRLGLTLATVTGEIVAALARGAPSPVAIAPFDLSRFERRRA